MPERSEITVIGSRLLLWIVLCGLGFGCASTSGPQEMTIAGHDYGQTFDAAVEVARRESLLGGLRDRRMGIIETDTAFAPTLLEPWYAHREAADRLIESTISFQRRRARFEFAPIASSIGEDVDLTQYDGELSLRVFVHVERQHSVGLRRSTWTRRAASWEGVFDESGTVTRTWVPVGRDPAMEQRLLRKVQAAIDRSGRLSSEHP